MIKIYFYFLVFLMVISSLQSSQAQSLPRQNNFKKIIAKAKKLPYLNSANARVAALKKLPLDAQFYVWNDASNSWILSSTGKYTYDISGNKLSSISLTPAGDTFNAQYYTYDSRGYLIDNITRETNGIKLVNKFRYKTEYDRKGNETLYQSYTWITDKWVLESGRKHIITYDALERLSEEVTQICSKDEIWQNRSKETYSYPPNSGMYSGVIAYSWEEQEWVKFYELNDVIWRDFNKDIVISANQFEYEDGILAYSSRISSVMNGSTLVELYEEKIEGVWTSTQRLNHTANTKGDEISLLEEFEGGAWLPINKLTEYKDEKGENAGYKMEIYEEGRWFTEDAYIYLNTYNANGEKTETINESTSLSGVSRSRTTYSNFVEVDVTGSTGHEALVLVSLYPNPAKDEITFTGLVGTLDVGVMNVTNQVVLTQTIVAGAETINISRLTSGLYYVCLRSSAGTVKTLKLIKQ